VVCVASTPCQAFALPGRYTPLTEGGFQGWGCNRFCTLSELVAKGGYKPETDCITFRIEFTVDNKRLKLEQDISLLCKRLDLLEKRGNIPACMEWTLRNWSTLPLDVSFFSPVTLRGNQRWRGSIEKKKGGHVSIYLRYEKGYRPVKVDFKLMLLSSDGSPAIVRDLTHVYEPFEDGGYTGWGYHKFCTLDELRQKGAYSLEQDSITVRIEFNSEDLPSSERTPSASSAAPSATHLGSEESQP